MCRVFGNNDLITINTFYKTDTRETVDLKPNVKVTKMHTVKP